MKKLISALFLGLFVLASAPVLHADDAAAGTSSTEAAPKKAHHKKHTKHKKHKKAKAAAADSAAK